MRLVVVVVFLLFWSFCVTHTQLVWFFFHLFCKLKCLNSHIFTVSDTGIPELHAVAFDTIHKIYAIPIHVTFKRFYKWIVSAVRIGVVNSFVALTLAHTERERRARAYKYTVRFSGPDNNTNNNNKVSPVNCTFRNSFHLFIWQCEYELNKFAH